MALTYKFLRTTFKRPNLLFSILSIGIIAMTTSRSIPTSNENQTPLYLVNVEDLQDLNQAKAQVEKIHARFREIIESVSDIYFIHDMAGNFTYLAPQITNFLSYPVESLLGHNLDEITHPDDLAPIETMIQQILETRISHENIEMRVRHANGNWVWLSVSHSVMVDETDTIIGIQGFALEESFTKGHVVNPEITIQTLKEDDRIIISITDNGLDIEPEQLSRLFYPFYTTKPVGQGTSMGLSISYKIVGDRHGGTLDCISAIGSGTKFIITLPIKH